MKPGGKGGSGLEPIPSPKQKLGEQHYRTIAEPDAWRCETSRDRKETLVGPWLHQASWPVVYHPNAERRSVSLPQSQKESGEAQRNRNGYVIGYRQGDEAER